MSHLRFVALGILLWACTTSATLADDKKPELSEKQFRRICLALREDPSAESARELAMVIFIYVSQSPDVAVMLGDEEFKWFGKDKKRKFLLLAAYDAGNAESQLNSGLKRNDRYSGLLSLFKVYRALKDNDKAFLIVEVEELLKLHKGDRLVPYLTELEKKKPTKLTAEQEREIKRLRDKRK